MSGPVSHTHPARRSGPALLAVAMLAAALGTGAVAVTSLPVVGAQAVAAEDPVLVAGGDIACRPGRTTTATRCQHAGTADLVQSLAPTVVLPLGDTQYDSGSPSEYAQSYDPTWGAFRSTSRPAVGNHEYRTTGAGGYYGYFGALAGDPAKGYYSYDIQGPTFRWHLVSLNTECAQVGGCGVGSPQEVWLRQDLAANPHVCTLAYSHRPRFSSGSVIGSSSSKAPLFQALYDAGADLFLSGHAHHYERFAPQTAAGAIDPLGVTQFVVGTGGDDFQGLSVPEPNSLVRQNHAFGVLRLALHANSYDYSFEAAAGSSFTDAGSRTCRNAPPSDTVDPSTPTGLTATASSPNRVRLSWQASTDDIGVRGYTIYRGADSSAPVELTTTTDAGTVFVDETVSAATTYDYTVAAVDAAGNSSAMSDPATVTTPATADTSAPSAPGSLRIEAITSNEVDLGWAASTDSGTGVSGYRVYRAVAGTTAETLVGTTDGTDLRFQDLTVEQNTRYRYSVSAFDGADNISARSASVTAATPPGPTTASYAFPPSDDATLVEASPTANAGADTRVIVDSSPVRDTMLRFALSVPRCDALTAATLRLVNVDSSPLGGDVYSTGSGWDESTVTWSSAPDRGTLLNSLGAVNAGGTYTVDVTDGVNAANDEVNLRLASSSRNGARYYSKEGAGNSPNLRPTLTLSCTNDNTDTLAPTAPDQLEATASAGQVDLSWQEATDNVLVTGYNVYRDGVLLGTAGGETLSYADSTVEPGTQYAYRVSALDAAANEGPRSNPVTVTADGGTPPPPSAPAPPSGLAAGPVDPGSVEVTWTASPTGTVTDYQVYRDDAPVTPRVPAGTTPLRHLDTGLTAGTTYRYTVTAISPDGESTRPAAVTATTPAAPPPPPPPPPAPGTASPCAPPRPPPSTAAP